MTGWIGIALGDVTGIAPEVTLKALAAEAAEGSQQRYEIIGDAGYLHRLNGRLGLNFRLPEPGNPNPAGNIRISNPLPAPLLPDLPAGAALAAQAAVAWLKAGAEKCLRGELDAMVTAPVSKESIIRSGMAFAGQTEYLSQLAGTDRTVMMLLGHDDRGRWLRVALATNHLPLRQVADRLNQNKIGLAIELASQACRDLGLPRARVGVCGLNPHAGEGGAMGNEEITTIGPAVLAAQNRQLDAVGPISADALFFHAYRGAFDAIIAMYHDQGLAPMKMVAFESGVNWTLGLPFIRTSPDHGTAYDIVGKGIANPSSMRAAMNLAKRLVEVRKRQGAQQ